MEEHFRHFNARETLAAAKAYKEHLDNGGKMFIALAGAMSTGELGTILGKLIRADKVHAISCTGANLEEDVYNLIGRKDYREIPNYVDLDKQKEADLRAEDFNRVTDSLVQQRLAKRGFVRDQTLLRIRLGDSYNPVRLRLPVAFLDHNRRADLDRLGFLVMFDDLRLGNQALKLEDLNHL